MTADRSPWPLHGRLDQRDPRIQAASVTTAALQSASKEAGAVSANGQVLDWKLLHVTLAHLSIDQRETEIAPYGCAFMCAVEAGRVIAGRPVPGPDEVVRLWREATQRDVLGDECFVYRWWELLRITAGGYCKFNRVPGSPADATGTDTRLVIAYWHQPERPRLGGHFVLPAQPLIPDAYDPLGSAEPGLSWTRKRGEPRNYRVFDLG